ncbi:MAG: acyl-CoA dehydrogenase family protein, partial [Rhodospirillales bacterium]|nr:acyl-CoA dehydrogenase family protein [Rhodospirillales bacterium]
YNQPEGGALCPIAMTYAVIPALRRQSNVADEWEPRLRSTRYDPRAIPASEKTGASMGMFMTEKQGGSDVRANTTRAVPLGAGGPGGEYELNGHKFFCSAPMSDAFLSLAYTENGLCCFLIPRWRPDGTRNALFTQRLKDKLGNRSNASAEIELSGTYAVMVGEEGRGVRTIIDMVQHTRLYCALGSSGLMRQGLVQALHHTTHRSAFQKKLIQQPLMRNVLADLAVESEAATVLSMRLGRAFDESAGDPAQTAFARIATAVAKYWICKRAPGHVYESMECHGGPGYIEESILPRLYREAPVNSIWEGSGNVICLDILRAMHKEPETVTAFMAEVDLAKGGDARLDAAIKSLKQMLADPADAELRARSVAERMALVLQGSLLVRHAPTDVADAFCASRLGSERSGVYGTLPAGSGFDAIIERAAGR